MKKILSFCLTLLLLTSFGTSYLAAEQSASQGNIDTFQQEAIEILRDTPQEGTLLLPDGREQRVKGNLIRTEVTSSDSISCTYSYNISLVSNGGSQTIPGTDKTYSITAYNTIEWTPTYVGGTLYVLLTKVSGSWTYLDSQVIVSNCTINYGCMGTQVSGGPVNQSGSKNPTSNSFSYNTGFTQSVGVGLLGCNVGNSMTLTLKRGTASTWTLVVENRPFVTVS